MRLWQVRRRDCGGGTDRGSAKMLVAGEKNVAYICSRYYRAPELIFGATEYTISIGWRARCRCRLHRRVADVWSVGCVFAELMLGQPLFPGESSVDQLVEIIKILGTPTREQIFSMNPHYNEFKFPLIKAHPWSKAGPARAPPPSPCAGVPSARAGRCTGAGGGGA